MQITIYTTSTCPNCQILKELLKSKNLPFKEENMATPAALTELSMHNIFAMTAPVLRIDDKFYSNITNAGKLDIPMVESILKSHGT
jgi:glutaredoxin